MPIEYHPRRPRGCQWSVTDPDGRRHENLSARIVEGLLTRQGMSVRQIQAAIAQARLAPSTAA